MIESFQGSYRFLSNFWPVRVEYDGIIYPTSEHAYQASKTNDQPTRAYIATLDSPGKAKRYGARFKTVLRHLLRHDWDEIKLSVMEEIVRIKFSLPSLRRGLLETGDQEIVEGNNHGDMFWGICDGVGENHLGKILMKVRDDCRNDKRDV